MTIANYLKDFVNEFYKKIKKEKGSFLVLGAILIPVIYAFWQWIMTTMILLNLNINQQITADVAVISGIVRGSGEPNNSSLEEKIFNRTALIVQAMADLNSSAVPSTQMQLSANKKTLTIILNSPDQKLYFKNDMSIHATSSANENALLNF
jgi:hypothetical protein